MNKDKIEDPFATLPASIIKRNTTAPSTGGQVKKDGGPPPDPFASITKKSPPPDPFAALLSKPKAGAVTTSVAGGELT